MHPRRRHHPDPYLRMRNLYCLGLTRIETRQGLERLFVHLASLTAAIGQLKRVSSLRVPRRSYPTGFTANVLQVNGLLDALLVFFFLITNDFRVPRVKDYPHSRVDTKVIHQEPRSATLIEFRPGLAEQRINSKIEIEILNL